MAYFALLIAIVAGGAGAFLWRVDARQRSAAREGGAGESPAGQVRSDEPELEPAGRADAAGQEAEVVVEAPVQQPPPGSEPEPEIAEPEIAGPQAADAEPVPDIIEAEVVEEEGGEDEEEDGDATPEPEARPEPAPEEDPGQDPEPAPEPAPKPTRQRPPGLHLPGLLRRERRSWAEAHGFTFTRRDEFLVDEWSRGAAATGAPARDIVSGSAYGHELLLMELGRVNVMAMRTGESSEVVVDLRRTEFDDPDSSGDDLIRVEAVEGFTVYATEAGVGKRLVDIRVTTALSRLPESVTAVWMESDWVLAQTTPASRSGDWDAMLAPLALLADAARVLPPQGEDEDTEELVLGDFTPSRPVAHPVAPDALAAVPEIAVPDESELAVSPPVVRPEEPLEMPTRTRAEYRGTVPPRALGVDDVDAIADGRESQPQNTGTRMPRKFFSGPSIFDDGGDDRAGPAD